MKVSNVKCFILGSIILVNSSFFVSCDAISDKFDRITNKDFYDFLDENGIVPVSELDDYPKTYYEAEVSEHEYVSDGNYNYYSHYERLDSIDNVICRGREFDYDYKVLKVDDNDNGSYNVEEKIVDDLQNLPLNYDYVYEDDFVIEKGYSDVLINYGKIIKR